MAFNTSKSAKAQRFWVQVFFISGVPLIMVLGNSILIPVLPDIKNALNLTPVQSSLIITMFSVPAAIIIPLAGFLSDRYGRKVVIIPSLILYGLGGVLAALASVIFLQYSYALILTGRVLQGMGAAGTAPIAMALCGDLFKGSQRSRSLGIIESANGLGKVISPVLGAAIGLIAWYAAFFFFPVVVIPVVLGLWLSVKESDTNRATQGIPEYLKSFGTVFKKKAGLLLSSYYAGAVALLVLFGVLFYLSEFLETQFGVDGIQKGLVLAIPVLFMSATSFITGFLIKKEQTVMRIVVVVGLILISSSLILLPLVQNVILYFIVISIMGTGTGMVLPCLNTIITSSASKKERGLITSLYGSVRFLGVAIGPPLYGYLMNLGTGIMFWSSAGLSIAGVIITILFMGGAAGKTKNTFVFQLQPARKRLFPMNLLNKIK